MSSLPFRPVLFVIATLLFAACGAESPTTPDPDPDPVTVASVVVTSDSASVLPGAAITYSARILDSDGNVMTGRAVVWSTADTSVATIDASTGIARAMAEGSTSVMATSGGVTGTDSITVQAPPLLGPVTRVWRADAATSRWSGAGNWLPPGVPANNDTVRISAGANQPVLAEADTIAELTVEVGASLSLDSVRLVVNGSVSADSAVVSGTGWLDLNGVGAVSGMLPELRITGMYTLAGSTSSSSHVLVRDGGRLDVGPETLEIAGNLHIDGREALLLMTDPAGEVDVEGMAHFQGGDSFGVLTAGELRVAGDLQQGPGHSFSSFFSTESHTTVLDGDGAQRLSVAEHVDIGRGFANLVIQSPDVELDGLIRVYARATVREGARVWGSGRLHIAGTLASEASSTIEPARVDVLKSMAIAGTFAPELTMFWSDTEIQPLLDYRDILILGTQRLQGTTSAAGDVRIEGRGRLEIGPHSLHVGGQLLVADSALFVMTNPAGEVDVQGQATFAGEDTEELLTAGTLRVAGRFLVQTQRGFSASDGHLTVLEGNNSQLVSFSHPGLNDSYFANLAISGDDVWFMDTGILVIENVSHSGRLTILEDTVLYIRGDLTLDAGSSLLHYGTITVIGTCTDNGATVSGTGTGNHPCIDP